MYPPITDPNYCWASCEVDKYSSKYSTCYLKKILEIYKYDVCVEDLGPHLGVVGCKRLKRVYRKPPIDSEDYTYVYEYFFKNFGICFPLSNFES